MLSQYYLTAKYSAKLSGALFKEWGGGRGLFQYCFSSKQCETLTDIPFSCITSPKRFSQINLSQLFLKTSIFILVFSFLGVVHRTP